MSEMTFGVPFEFLLIIIVIAIGISIIIIRKLVSTNKLLKLALLRRQSNAALMGRNAALGNIHELLGKFAYFTKLKDWWLLSGPSKQSSIDMIGVRDDYLEIIEFKKNGARITPSENEIRRMIEAQKVRYVVLDVKMPDNVTVEPRELKPVRRRNVKVASST